MNDLAEFIKNIQKSNDFRRIDLEGRVLVAHQAEFLPWLGFVSKASMGDYYLIIDNSQFKKEYFENRNKIRVKSDLGWEWLTVPVDNKTKIRNINEYSIANEKYIKLHLKKIKYSYSRTKYFDEYFPKIEAIYKQKHLKLIDMNIALIKWALDEFKITLPIFKLSIIEQDVEIKGKSTDWVVELCRACKADVFVAGISGQKYLDKQKFRENNIQLVFQDFAHPKYEQYHGDFLQGMSFIDLLFNHGPDAINILGKSNYILGD